MRYRNAIPPTNPARLPFFVARNPYAWPGGYPVALLMSDGACLCPDCAKSEAALISRHTRDRDTGSGWEAAAAINLETFEEAETCAHCDRVIFDPTA